MQTSYFNNIRHIDVPVSISQGTPSWYLGYTYKELAPSWQLVHGHKARKEGMSKTDYTARYYEEVLSKLDPWNVYDEVLERFGPNATFLCYEDLNRSEFCHRRIFADWMLEHTGIDIPEWKPPPLVTTSLQFDK